MDDSATLPCVLGLLPREPELTSLGGRELRQRRPIISEQVGAERREVGGAYVVTGANSQAPGYGLSEDGAARLPPHGHEGQGGSKTAWYSNGKVMLRAQLDPTGQVVKVERWDDDGRPVTAEEWSKRDAQKQEQMRAVAKALELPFSIILSGLK